MKRVGKQNTWMHSRASKGAEGTKMARSNLKAVALITGDNKVRGSLQFFQDPDGTTHVSGKITGLKPGPHGFHIHSFGDTTNGCNSTGPHFNPLNKVHGSPSDSQRHAGDLGNIFAGPDGVAEVSIKDRQIPLSGQHSILGRAVVVHADPDDLGRGGHELSKTTGNAGARIGCGNHLLKPKLRQLVLRKSRDFHMGTFIIC